MMKQIERFLCMLAVILPTIVWAQEEPVYEVYIDENYGVAYEYVGTTDTARVAKGYIKHIQESDFVLLSQTYVNNNTIADEVVIPESLTIGGKNYTVTEVGQIAFYHETSIQRVTIPKTVRTIQDYAFTGCSSLTDIYCYANPDKLAWYYTGEFFNIMNGVPKDVRVHVIAGYQEKYQSKFSDMGATFVGDLEGEVEPDDDDVIMGTTGDLTWKAVETGTILVWDYNTYAEVEKPQYRLTISGTGKMADYSDMSPSPWRELATITEVVLEDGAESIGAQAFEDLEYLMKVSLPNSLRSIGGDAFAGTNLTEIILPEGLLSIGNGAFWGVTSLRSITIPASLTSLGSGCFAYNELESLTVAEGSSTFYSPAGSNAVVRKADDVLVLGCPNTVIPNTVKGIGDFAFYLLNSLKTLIIPESVTTIGYRAIAYCFNLRGSLLLTGVTTIGEQAFIYAENVTEVVLGPNLTSIGKGAFSSCKMLEDIYCYADPTKLTWEDYDNAKFFKSEKGTKFHVKAADKGAWETTFPDLNATIVGDLDGEQVETDGDVDGNGETTAADVVAVTNVINGTVTDEKTKAAADVNKDGKVDIADIVALVNLIFGK